MVIHVDLVYHVYMIEPIPDRLIKDLVMNFFANGPKGKVPAFTDHHGVTTYSVTGPELAAKIGLTKIGLTKTDGISILVPGPAQYREIASALEELGWSSKRTSSGMHYTITDQEASWSKGRRNFTVSYFDGEKNMVLLATRDSASGWSIRWGEFDPLMVNEWVIMGVIADMLRDKSHGHQTTPWKIDPEAESVVFYTQAPECQHFTVVVDGVDQGMGLLPMRGKIRCDKPPGMTWAQIDEEKKRLLFTSECPTTKVAFVDG